MPPTTPFSARLRHWRSLRGLTQLQLSLVARVSQRHISFLETGRSRPGREMIERLSAVLDLPLRERNTLLQLAGLPASYDERPPNADADAMVRDAIARTIAAHEPYPALVVNGWWDIVQLNAAASRLFPPLAEPDTNLAAALLEPGPVRAAIVDWEPIAQAVLARLQRESRHSPLDSRLHALCERARAQLTECEVTSLDRGAHSICPEFRVGDRSIRTFSMVGELTAVHEMGLEELRVELIYPRDAESRQLLRDLAAAAGR